MGNGHYRINLPGMLIVRIQVHPTVLRDVTVSASDSQAHAVERACRSRGTKWANSLHNDHQQRTVNGS